MNRRRSLALLSAGTLGFGLPRRARAGDEDPGPEAIFARAKDVWRARDEAPFVTFNLRERYDWRGAAHENWWQVAYRDEDRALALTRTIVPEDETKRLRGSPIQLNFRWHHGAGKADSFDTNRDADAFPVLDPLIVPNASFGLLHREQKPVLAGGPPRDARISGSAGPGSGDAPSPEPAASPAPQDGTLRELVRVEAVARDYAIANAGTERVRGTDAYHLTLTPLRAPNVNRLRDLWVDVRTFETVQLAVHGLFDGKPYEDARWLVTYVRFGGRGYVQQIATDDTLRFGIDRFVTGLAFDFVGYDFPATIPPLTFERLLI
jgi:hypothetical protein